MRWFPLMIAICMLTLCACGADRGDEVAVLAFDMDWSHPDAVNVPWTEARENPAQGVAFPFPVKSQGIDRGVEVRLIVGRSSTEGSALTTGNDVIIAEQRVLSTKTLDKHGRAEFGPLDVALGDWSTDTNSIPYSYLCGETVVAARAFRVSEGDVSGSQFLAATWFYMVAEPCD